MIEHKVLENGFSYIEIKNSHAKAKIALQGAHLFHYQAKGGKPLLWLSQSAFFQKGKAIRGGIPICFPWFGPHEKDATLPQHGFARTSLWTLILEEELSDGSTHIQLQLLANNETKKLWNYNFDVRLDVVIGSTLTVTLITKNIDSKPFKISTALHSYFTISDIENITIEGLKGSQYFNALDGKEYSQNSNLTIYKELDRVYFNTSKNITLVDKERNIFLNQEGSNSLVIWNPWQEKSSKMVDMEEGAYREMVCLETGNIAQDARTLEAGEEHKMQVSIESAIKAKKIC